jgi:hypothetical protein
MKVKRVGKMAQVAGCLPGTEFKLQYHQKNEMKIKK